MEKAKTPQLIPESQFPKEALAQSVQDFPAGGNMPSGNLVFTWNIASVADSITPWGRSVAVRDRQLRDFWPTETYLAGAVASVAFRNAAYDWEIRHLSDRIEQVVTDMLNAAIAGDSFGWSPFVQKFSQDLYTQDNGAFIEIIREPTTDATSPFKNERAPVLGIAHLDSNQCIRTGDPKYPVLYTDRKGKIHKLAWYEVIPFSDFPSAIERMNGVGYCSVTRALRAAQILRSIFIFKDEKISGRHYKQISFVSGVSRQDIKDEMKRGQEDADNKGQIRFIEPSILASLDPEKPVSVATIDLASFPDNFDFDQEMKWYISGLALAFGVDYQEFAPLPGGGIGSSNQSSILARKSSGKGPAMFMKIAKAFQNYGVLPRDCEMIFEDRSEEKELDKQTLRKMFQEEMALAIRNGFLSPGAARKISIDRGLYKKGDFAGMEQDYGEGVANAPKNSNSDGVGPSGGNTVSEDAGRTDTGAENDTAGARLRKELEDEHREERKGLLDVLRTAVTRPVPVKKDTPVQPIVNVDVHNHPGKPPIVNIAPELHADLTARLITPKETHNNDNALARAFSKMAAALMKQKPPVIPPANVTVNVPATPVTLHQEIKSNKPDETDEVLKAIRKTANDG